MADKDRTELYEVFTDKPLGVGRFGKVFKGVLHQNNKEVAIKRIEITEDGEWDRKYLKGEVDALRRTQHANIVKIYHAERSTEHLYIILEYCVGGDLNKFIAKNDLSEETMLRFLKDSADGVNHLHCLSPPIVHRDLKPANLLVQIGEDNVPTIKVTDFGIASSRLDRDTMTVCGTENYAAPEINPDKQGHVNYDTAVDVFALGLIYLELINHQPGQELKSCKVKSQPLGKWFWLKQFNELPAPAPEIFHPTDTALQECLKAVTAQMIRADSKQRPQMHDICEMMVVIKGAHDVQQLGDAEETKLAGLFDAVCQNSGDPSRFKNALSRWKKYLSDLTLLTNASAGKALKGIYQCLDEHPPNRRCEVVIRPCAEQRHTATNISLPASTLDKKASTVNCISTSMKLSEQAFKEVKSIDDAIEKSESTAAIKQQCLKFMKTFGSHCNHGQLEFCYVFDIKDPPTSEDGVDELAADEEFDEGNKKSLKVQGSPSNCTNDLIGGRWDLLNGENAANMIGIWMLIPNHLQDLQHSDTIKETMFHVWKQIEDSLLAKLKLRRWYPNKITLADVMKSPVNCSNPEYVSDLEHMPWRMLLRFITLDYNCRDDDRALHVKTSNEEEEANDEIMNWEHDIDEDDISPLDVFLAIYNCCDLILKQTLLHKMQMCNLALPFICPDFSGELTASLWSLRSIVLEWQGHTDEQNGGKPHDEKSNTKEEGTKMGIERHLVEVEAPIISFLQLKNPGISKSKFAGRVLNKTEHPTFFHKDCKNGQVEKTFANGYIELATYEPSGKQDDRFRGVTHFLNLRGDAAQLTTQLKLLEQISSVIVVFVEMDSFSNETCLAKMQEICEKSKNVVLVIHAQNMPTSKVMQEFQTQYKKAKFPGKRNLKSVPTFSKQKPKNEERLKDDIHEAIRSLLFAGTKIEHQSILKLKSTIKSKNILIDEDNDACQCGYNLAEQVTKELNKSFKIDPNKSILFPLQHDPWADWCRHKKDSHRKKNVDRVAAIQGMIVQREKQLKMCSSQPTFMTIALETLHRYDDQTTLVFFMRWLNYLLKSQALQNLPKLKLQRDNLWSEPATADLQRRIEKVEEKLSNNSIDIHNFIREIGQMYEATIENHIVPSSQLAAMPKRVAMLLCEGFPIELMHGDSTSIPLVWIQAILKETNDLIEDKKLFVLSVLGVQSSGKSTLLNAMFGCALSVSAGQATRGAFMQLLPLPDPSVSGLKLHYVLVVDTEGLRAPELGFQKNEHDNELSTTAIGLADLTVMNIKGENFADINDILQIAVQSFLRLQLVKSSQELSRKCVFVHQNVPAVNAKEKLRDGLRILQENLDTLTMDAARVTGHEDIQSFCQVIDFDHQHHVWYLSDLWHGDPPMAPVNTGYSTTVQKVKKEILEHVAHHHKMFTIEEISNRVKDLWNAVLSENFVFYFRNTMAVKVYQELETKMLEMCWKWECLCHQQCAAEVHNAVYESTTKQELAAAESQITEIVDDTCRKELDLQSAALSAFIKSHRHADIMEQWKEEKLQTLRSYFMQIKDKSFSVVSCKIAQRNFDVTEMMDQDALKANMTEKAKELAESIVDKMPTNEEIQHQFDDIWEPWLKKVLQKQTPLEVDICKEMVSTLETYLFNNIPSLKAALNNIHSGKKPLEKWPHAVSLANVTLDDIQGGEHIVKQKYHGHISADDAKQKCSEQIQKIFFRVEQHLKSLGSEDINFKTYCGEVIHMVMDGVTRINEDDMIYIRIHPDLEVKLIVTTASYACKVFKGILKSYMESHGIHHKLTKFRIQMNAFFELKAKSSSAEAIACQLLQQQLAEVIPYVVLVNMSQAVVGELMIKFCRHKYHFIGEILTNLAETDNFFKFASYIDDPVTFAQKWLEDYINKEFFGKDNAYAKLAELKCQRFVRLVIEYLDILKKKFNAKKQGKISLDKIITKLLKLSKDADDLRKDEVTLGQLVKLTGHSVELTDPCHFIQMIIKFLHGLTEKSLEECFLKVTAKSVNWYGDAAFKKAFEKLWGCTQLCAFCNEPCMKTSEHSTSDHRSLQHRPQGVGGMYIEQPRKTLITINCNQLVDSDKNFECQSIYPKCQVQEHKTNIKSVHKYREYKTYMKRWDIAPSNEGSTFWQWFSYKYQKQLKQKYNCSFHAESIKDWKSITRDEAIASLKEMRV